MSAGRLYFPWGFECFRSALWIFRAWFDSLSPTEVELGKEAENVPFTGSYWTHASYLGFGKHPYCYSVYVFSLAHCGRWSVGGAVHFWRRQWLSSFRRVTKSPNTKRLILELGYGDQDPVSPSRAFPFFFQKSILEREEGADNLWVDH